MKKRLLLVLAVLSIAILSSCSMKSGCIASCNSNEKLSNKILEYSAAIVVSSPLGKFPVGSGVFVETSYGKVLITAQHVADLEDEIFGSMLACSFADMNDCVSLDKAYIADSSEEIEDDWAIYSLEEFPEAARGARINKALPRVGQEVVLSGIPQGHVPWISFGNVGYVWLEGEMPLVGINGYAFFGSSGGGVFNTRGQLIGIISSIGGSQWGPMENKVFIAPIGNIHCL